MKGLVIKNTGSWYTVRANDGSMIDCKVKGNFRLKGIRSTSPVAIGDRVEFIPQPDNTALITDIDERKNYIIRKSTNLSKQSHILAANLDQCFLFVTISHPTTSTTFIDRFLATAEAYSIPVTIIFNKIDLYDDADKEYLDGIVNLYETIGYKCLSVSLITGDGMGEIRTELLNPYKNSVDSLLSRLDEKGESFDDARSILQGTLKKIKRYSKTSFF